LLTVGLLIASGSKGDTDTLPLRRGFVCDEVAFEMYQLLLALGAPSRRLVLVLLSRLCFQRTLCSFWTIPTTILDANLLVDDSHTHPFGVGLTGFLPRLRGICLARCPSWRPCFPSLCISVRFPNI